VPSISLLHYGHLQHFALHLQSGMRFRTSLCVTEYQDLDFELAPAAVPESTGELEILLTAQETIAMTKENTLISKVLVLDNSRSRKEPPSSFCKDNNPEGPESSRGKPAWPYCASNVDLGGIMIAEDLAGKPPETGCLLGHRGGEIRRELPLFLRCASSQSLAALSTAEREPFASACAVENIEALEDVIETSISTLVYPAKLVTGIAEMTQASPGKPVQRAACAHRDAVYRA